MGCVKKGNSVYYNFNKKQNDNSDAFPNWINSMYYDVSQFNQIKHTNDTFFSLLHTDLASLLKYHDDLDLTLSILKMNFDIISITEHKLGNQHTTLILM